MADVEFDDFDGGYMPARPQRVQRWVNLAGGLTSVGLIVGLGIWGYNLAVRDVAGIPVVRAMEGPMRIAPENPGGEIASHQGLSVNAVAAVGTALPPADRLVLAPRPVELDLEDGAGLDGLTPLPQDDGTQAAVAPATIIPTRDPEAEARALAAALAEGSEPLSSTVEPPIPVMEPAPVELAGEDVMPDPNSMAPADLELPRDEAPKGAVLRSVRPPPRPAAIMAAAAAVTDVTPVSASATAAVPVTEVDAATLKAGTRLVQLGAFDDAEAARKGWDKLHGQFGALMEGKARVVQSAQSGGRTFFRLRVHGFEDEADARRFCSALLAEKADCIPVAVR